MIIIIIIIVQKVQHEQIASKNSTYKL